ncbi:MAG: MFS transporter [Pseudomonadota bacterium]
MTNKQAWRVVAALFVLLTISSGFGFYNLSVYLNALSQQNGFAVEHLSFAITLFFVVSGLFGVVIARLLERVDVRWVLTGGTLVCGVAMALVGRAESTTQLLVIYALFGAGYAGVSLIPATTLVARWFPGANRSVALATASTGLSLGGVLITPLAAYLLETRGLSRALPEFGLAFAVCLLPIVWLWVREPSTQAASAAADPASEQPEGWPERQAMQSRFYRAITIVFLLLLGSQVGGIAHLYNHAELLTDRVTASTAVQILGLASITGRLAGGWLLRYVSTRGWLVGCALGQAVGLVVLALAAGQWQLWLGALFFGLTVGNILMLLPLVLVEGFGLRAYARLYATANAVSTIGVGGGPALLGLLFASSGYAVAFCAAAACTTLATIGVLIAGPVPDPQRLGSESLRQPEV